MLTNDFLYLPIYDLRFSKHIKREGINSAAVSYTLFLIVSIRCKGLSKKNEKRVVSHG